MKNFTFGTILTCGACLTVPVSAKNKAKLPTNEQPNIILIYAAVGKWHLGIGEKTGTQNWNVRIAPGPYETGFDYSYLMAATGDRVPCVYLENQRVANLDPNDPISVIRPGRV